MNKIPIQRPRNALLILTVNGGSLSIRLVLYQTGKSLKKSLNGSVDRIDLPGTNLFFSESDFRFGLESESRKFFFKIIRHIYLVLEY